MGDLSKPSVEPSLPKRRGRPPLTLKEPVIQEPAPVEQPSRDGVIELTLRLPSHAPVTRTIRITNLLGNAIGTQRSPDGFMEILKTALRRQFPGVK